MPTRENFESLFSDPAGVLITIEPLTQRITSLDELMDYFGDGLVIDPECRDLFEPRLQRSHHRVQLGSRTLRRQMTLTTLERALERNRFIEPWMLLQLLRLEKQDREGWLETGGIMNLLWIPRPVVVYYEHLGEMHVKPLQTTNLDRFTRVFFVPVQYA